jgi:hypothetical protein
MNVVNMRSEQSERRIQQYEWSVSDTICAGAKRRVHNVREELERSKSKGAQLGPTRTTF